VVFYLLKQFSLVALSFFISFYSIQADASWIKLTGNIQINIEEQKVKIPLSVVNLEGGLEFILTIGDTKDYESVFSIKSSAKELHLAMATVGFEPNGYIQDDEKKEPIPNSKVDLNVQFGEKTHPLIHYLSWNGNRKIEHLPFYFCGSYFKEYAKRKEYAADLDLNVIAAYPSEEMVIGPLVKVANPYQEKEGAYLTPNKETLPPIGTNGWLLIQKHSP